MLRDVVVVGASLAGLRAAETLRTDGFDGRLAVVGAETHLPYDRPPLSKKVLAGEWEPDRIHLRKPDEYDDLGFDLHLGVKAVGLDTAARQVRLSDGSALPFDGLVIATGAAPRRLPGQPELPGIFELRTLDDSPRAAPRPGGRAAPRGGGRRRLHRRRGGGHRAGVAVWRSSLVEALPVPLARGLGPALGAAIGELHRAQGVDVRLGVGVEAMEGGERVERIRLTDGTVLEADVVVVGVGVAPVTDWLEGSGLELRDGVVCDATLAAGPPGVYAAGDLARWPNELFGEEMRVEHWTNAAEQGAAAARNLLATGAGGAGTAYAPVPFFWSDQFDARIQFLGRAGGDDDVEVVHGALDSSQFVALYGRAGRFRGVFGLSSPKLVMRYRKLLLAGTSWDDALAFARQQEA